MICYDTVRTHKQCFCTRAVPHLRHPWEGHLLAQRERACVDALVFMFWRLAMMKESLFKSGLAGPPLNAPPFSPYNCMHALPASHAHTYKHMCKPVHRKSSNTHAGTFANFVFNGCNLDSVSTFPHKFAAAWLLHYTRCPSSRAQWHWTASVFNIRRLSLDHKMFMVCYTAHHYTELVETWRVIVLVVICDKIGWSCEH